MILNKKKETMKFIYKYAMFLLAALATAGIFFACSDDDLPNNGEPMISYIRITDPSSSDSLISTVKSYVSDLPSANNMRI